MKVLLILAAMPEVKANITVRYPVMAPPLTLALLGAICRRAGHAVELIDTRFYMERREGAWSLNETLLQKAIANSNADVAGISFLSSSALEGFRVAALCKQLGKTVVGGGLHASVAIDEFLASNAFHYIIQGEAEEIFPDLLHSLERGHHPKFPVTPLVLQAKLVRNLHAVPSVTDFSPYQPIFEQYPSYRTIYVETSRGCFKKCRFCEVAQTGTAWKPFRKMPLETVFSSIEAAVTHHQVNYVLVADSVATFFKTHFLLFIQKMSENFPNVTIQFNSTVDCWDEEIAKACASARCNVWFGFESGSQRVLDEIISKGTTVAQAYRAAELCGHYHIPCAFNILLGLPGETEEDYQQTLDVFKNFPWIYPNPNIFNPLPGTSLYDRVLEQGLLHPTQDYSIWDAERIIRSGRGPLEQVDYDLVLKYYHIYNQMQNEPTRSLIHAN